VLAPQGREAPCPPGRLEPSVSVLSGVARSRRFLGAWRTTERRPTQTQPSTYSSGKSCQNASPEPMAATTMLIPSPATPYLANRPLTKGEIYEALELAHSTYDLAKKGEQIAPTASSRRREISASTRSSCWPATG
jgi:hypothetical protein